ncbi:MAG TPA: hypothetical protein PLM24_06750 [Methanothrix sp.]|nr:hypothetical protein [Methanothrix sp.]HPJ83380.1 hypothetical protein [Methanothrix sp.]HPR66820.1 hypothetical protein [Methanothrix sp.]
MADKKNEWRRWHTILICVFLALILAVNYWALHYSVAGLAAETAPAGGGLGDVKPDPTPWLRVSTWIATFVLLTLIAVVIGRGKLGRNSGLLIDHRRRMSLSRTQMFLWTLIILSGFTTAVFMNLEAGYPEPMSISIPKELWALIGISITSLIGSPLIKDMKENQTGKEDESVKDTAKKLAANRGADPEALKAKSELDALQKEAKVYAVGRILYNESEKDASFSDLFSGEDGDDSTIPDLGKVQMFYFTVLLAAVYIFLLGETFFASGGVIDAFPALDSSMLALLGISNGGYLIKKAT